MTRRSSTQRARVSARASAAAQPLLLDRIGEGRPWLIPLVLFLLAFFFRLYFKNAGLFHHDEILLAKAVEGSLAQHRLLPAFHARYGSVLLNLLWYAPYHWLTGQSAEKTIVLSAIFSGALLIAVFHQLVLAWTAYRGTAILAALFVTFNLLFLTTSTIGKEQTHQLLFVVLAFWLAVRGARQDSLRLKLLAMASFTFGLAVHESTLVLVPAFVAILVIENASRRASVMDQLRDLGVFAAFLAVLFALYLGRVVVENFTRHDVTTIEFLGPLSPVLPMAARDLLTAAGLPLAILAVVGLIARPGGWRVMVPLALWMATFFYFGNTNGYTARYLILTIVPMCFLAACGVTLALRRTPSVPLRTVLALAAVAIVCGHGVVRAYPMINLRRRYCGPKEMALYVAVNTEPNALIVTQDEFPFIEYYGKRAWRNHPTDDYDANKKFVDELHAMAAAGRPLYIQTTAFSLDQFGHFRRLLMEQFQLFLVGEVVDEAYHRPELAPTLFKNRLFRLTLKNLPPPKSQ
jgi:hypothetical protein